MNRNGRTTISSPVFSVRSFDRHFGEHAGREGFKQIRQEIEGLGKLMQSLIDVREQKDETKTAATIALEYGKKYQQAQEHVKKRVDMAISKLVEMGEANDRVLVENSGLTKLSGREAEYREVLRGMTDKQRKAFIRKAVENRQPEVLNAIMDAPPELSGLREDYIQGQKDLYIELHHPEYKQEKDLIDTAGQMLALAVDGFKRQSEKIRDPYLEIEAEEKKKRADAADANFKALTSE